MSGGRFTAWLVACLRADPIDQDGSPTDQSLRVATMCWWNCCSLGGGLRASMPVTKWLAMGIIYLCTKFH